MKNRRNIIVAFLLCAVMLLGIGYATLTDTLTIIGNAHVDLDVANQVFDGKVYFSAAEATSTTGTGTQDDTAGYSTDDATFTANKLAVVGQKSVFTFTITNDSNVDAAVTINAKKLSGDVNPTNSNAEKFTVEYAYPDGMDIAKQGGTIDVVVTVTLKEPVTSATSATFGIELTVSSVEDNA